MKSYAITLSDNTNYLVVADSVSECVKFLGTKSDDIVQLQPINADTYVVGCSDSFE